MCNTYAASPYVEPNLNSSSALKTLQATTTDQNSGSKDSHTARHWGRKTLVPSGVSILGDP